MDSNQIYQILDLSMTRLAQACIVGFNLYCFATAIGEIAGSTIFHKRIKSQEELEDVVREEAPKLGLDPSQITSHFGTKRSYADKNEEGCEIGIKDSWEHATPSCVKHELKHIHNGDPHREYSFLKQELYYWLIAEPGVRLYEHFGIKV